MKYIIKGGNELNGEINISGAKNSVLPILASSILMPECHIENIPNLTDVECTYDILKHIKNSNSIPFELSNKMRSSVLFMGAMLGARGEAEIYYPGGCQIGKRPVDLHISALKKMGAEIKIKENKITAKAKKLYGCNIKLPYVSVGATENIILAGVKADGITIIENAATEPEIIDLTDFLNKCGAHIKIKGRKIYVKGVSKLYSANHRIIPDRIEGITYICAGAITGGELFLNNISSQYIKIPLNILRATGIIIKESEKGLYIDSPKKLKSISHFETNVYPGVPTDIQPQLCSLLSVAKGSTAIKENIFTNRISHTDELIKMGADINKINNNKYIIHGVDNLNGSMLYAHDLRGGAALVIAALKAEGLSVVDNISHIKRGYENMHEKLSKVGAEIEEAY